MTRRLKIAGEGCLHLDCNGQGMSDLERDPLAIKHAPNHKSGFDTSYLGRYTLWDDRNRVFTNTHFAQWRGRRSDGCFHPCGPIFQIVGQDSRAPEGV